MAINFGEVFLRESGAAQDRAQSMAELQLRAKQFADNLAIQEANLEISRAAQKLAEDKYESDKIARANELSETARQFDANLTQRKDEFAANLTQRQEELGLSKEELEERIRQFDVSQQAESERLKMEAKMFYDRLDTEEKQFYAKMGMDKEFFYADMEFRRPGEEARTAAIRGEEERAQNIAPLNEALLQRQIQAGAIANSLRAIELARETRGEAYATEQTSAETKRLLGLNPEDDLTNERAGNLLQTRILEEGLRQKEAATKLSELRTNLEIEPYSQEITQENIRDVSNLYSEDVRRTGLRTAFDQFAYSFLNPATLFDIRPKIDFVTAAFGIPAMSATGRYYDLQRATGVDAAEFVDPLAGPRGLLGKSLMESQMTPAQQEYYNYLNRSASLFADPTKEFTQGAYEIQPPFPIPFGPYTNPSSLIPPMMSQDVEE